MSVRFRFTKKKQPSDQKILKSKTNNNEREKHRKLKISIKNIITNREELRCY